MQRKQTLAFRFVLFLAMVGLVLFINGCSSSNNPNPSQNPVPTVTSVTNEQGLNYDNNPEASTVSFIIRGSKFSSDQSEARGYVTFIENTTGQVIETTITSWAAGEIRGTVIIPRGIYRAVVTVFGKSSVENVFFYKGTSTVSGVVTGTGGQPQQFAKVALGEFTTITDANGAYTLANVPAGAQTINANKFSYAVYSASIDVPPTQTVEVNISLTPLQGFYYRQPSLTGNAFQDIYSADANNLWAVGGGGTIMFTSDAGAHWNPVTTSNTATLSAIDFTSPTRGFAVGFSGTVLMTTNGGTTWIPVTEGIPTNTDLRDVDFINQSLGFIVGTSGVALYTSDGGTTWTQVPDVIATYDANKIQMVSETEVFGLGTDTATNVSAIFHATHNGTEWEVDTSFTLPVDYTPRDIFFLDATHGWVVGAEQDMYRYNGTNWQVVPNVFGSFDFNDIMEVQFVDATHGYVAGLDGLVLTTEDAGDTWTALDPGTTTNFRAMYFAGVNNGWVAGTNGTILYYNGTAWTSQSGTVIDTRIDFTGVSFISAVEGWVTANNNTNGRGEVYYTNDGGKTFTMQSFIGRDLLALDAYDADNIIAVGKRRNILYRRNGGAWTPAQVPNVAGNMDLLDVSYKDATNAIIGTYQVYYKTTDGGQSWNGTATPNISNNGVKYYADGTAWRVGHDYNTSEGFFAWSDDDGNTWITGHTTELNMIIDDVYRVDAQHAWATGWFSNGIQDKGALVYLTVNGGTITSSQPVVIDDARFSKVVFTDATHGFVLGTESASKVKDTNNMDGTIYATSDGGATWTRVVSSTGKLLDLAIFDPTNLFAVGDGQNLLHYLAP